MTYQKSTNPVLNKFLDGKIDVADDAYNYQYGSSWETYVIVCLS